MSSAQKLLRRVKGKSSQSLICVEIFSGTGRLTASLRRFGFDSSFGVDCLSGKSVAPMIVLDLLTEQGQKHLWEVLSEPHLVFVHLAPPCGTSSRARLRQWKGAPPILRTDASPDGVPGLSPDQRGRVDKANLLYKICTLVCKFCHSKGILYSCENPFNSFRSLSELSFAMCPTSRPPCAIVCLVAPDRKRHVWFSQSYSRSRSGTAQKCRCCLPSSPVGGSG